MTTLMLRIRTQIGTWRLQDVHQSDTMRFLIQRLEKEHNTVIQHPFTSDQMGKFPLEDNLTVQSARFTNGQMLYLRVDETKTGVHEAALSGKKITKDGHIVQQDISSVLNSSGFRPGMLPLRSMKMQWTLNEFVALDEQFEYKIKHQPDPNCSKLTINSSCVNDFQSYMRNFDFRVLRVGYLYGKFTENNGTKVEFLYEPPQESTETTFQLLDDSKALEVEQIAGLLGLRRVGWIFAHPPREKGFYFSSHEAIFAAEQQLEAAEGINDTPFVTVKVTSNADTHEIVCEAFQVSKQCMEMVAEGVLGVSSNLGSCAVNPTFTAVVEGKNAKEVDTNFFITTVPIEQFESDFLVSMFPKANRIDTVQTRDDLKRQLKKAGREGWTFTSLLADFQLLLYLTNYLSVSVDFPLICNSIVNKDQALDEGYQLLLRSVAGLDE